MWAVAQSGVRVMRGDYSRAVQPHALLTPCAQCRLLPCRIDFANFSLTVLER